MLLPVGYDEGIVGGLPTACSSRKLGICRIWGARKAWCFRGSTRFFPRRIPHVVLLVCKELSLGLS